MSLHQVTNYQNFALVICYVVYATPMRNSFTMAKIKVHELRTKTKVDLLNQLKELKAELALLRVAKVTGGAPNKLLKIKVVRLSIAQVVTVILQTQKVNVDEAYSHFENRAIPPISPSGHQPQFCQGYTCPVHQ